jgi:hypothetical protein
MDDCCVTLLVRSSKFSFISLYWSSTDAFTFRMEERERETGERRGGDSEGCTYTEI